MRQIIVDHGIRKRLKAEGYGSYPTIRAALTWKSDTLTAKKIRQRAVQLGGVLVGSQGMVRNEL